MLPTWVSRLADLLVEIDTKTVERWLSARTLHVRSRNVRTVRLWGMRLFAEM